MNAPAILLALAGVASGSALAQQPVSWYLGGGTTGAGAGAAINLNERLDVRLEWTAGNTSGETRSDGNDYKTRIKLNNPGVIADWAIVGRFHLSAGLFYSNNRINVTGKPSSSGEYEFNGTKYSAAGVTAEGNTTLRKGVSPYLGVGWATRPAEGKGLGFRVEVGAMYQDPKTKLTVTGLAGPTAAADVAAEEQKLNDKLRKYRFYPVAQAFVAYTF